MRKMFSTGRIGIELAAAVGARAAVALGAPAGAVASTTCSWGGSPSAPTGSFTITPGLTNRPAPGALKFKAVGKLAGQAPLCQGRLKFVGQIDAGSDCAFAAFEGVVEGLPGVARFWGRGSLDVPSVLYGPEGNVVGVENAEIATEENLVNSLKCQTPEGFTGPAGFSSTVVLF